MLLWAADDKKNLSLSLPVLLAGAVAVIMPEVLYTGGMGCNPEGVAPAALLWTGKVFGINVGGADIFAAAIIGIVMGPFATLRVLLISSVSFFLIALIGKRHKKSISSAFIPYMAWGYLIEMFFGGMG